MKRILILLLALLLLVSLVACQAPDTENNEESTGTTPPPSSGNGTGGIVDANDPDSEVDWDSADELLGDKEDAEDLGGEWPQGGQ